jgi:hypothetical protein
MNWTGQPRRETDDVKDIPRTLDGLGQHGRFDDDIRRKQLAEVFLAGAGFDGNAEGML